MASLYTKQSHNVRRTFVLMSLFFVVFIGVAWFVSLYFSSPLFLYIAVLLAIGLNITAYWKSDVIAIRLTRAQPASREEYFDYWNSVENLCISIGVPMPKLYVINDPSPNAFATGRSPKRSAIAVTTGLLSMMDRTELEGVLAHELAHIQNRDTLLMTVIVVLIGSIVIVLDMALHALAFGGDDEEGGALMFVSLLALYIILPIVLLVIQVAVSRKREFLADATAGVYTRYPEGLASALEKIGGSHQPMRNAQSATAHLFISDPFASFAHTNKAGSKGRVAGLVRFFATHPPIEERVVELVGDA